MKRPKTIALRGKRLVQKLASAGHDVARSVDVIGGGASDQVVFDKALLDARSIVTLNNQDLVEIAVSESRHSGLILIYNDRLGFDAAAPAVIANFARLE